MSRSGYRQSIYRIGKVPVAVALLSTMASAQVRLEYLGPSNYVVLKENRYCGAYATWYAFRHFDRTVPLEAVVAELGPSSDNGWSVADLIRVLGLHGLSAKAVKFDIDQIPT